MARSRYFAGAAAVAVLAVGGIGAQSLGSELSASGPTAVSGTEATGVFRLAGRTIREVRYADRGVLAYRFRVHNEAFTPVRITGFVPPETPARLLRVRSVGATDGSTTLDVPARGSAVLEVRYLMTDCETLSARAGSFSTELELRTERLGVIDGTETIRFPEELHTGSPREVRCPNATADSRPAG